MTITIDIEKLRKDLMDDCYGAFFFFFFDASAEELIKIAERNGIDLREYAV